MQVKVHIAIRFVCSSKQGNDCCSKGTKKFGSDSLGLVDFEVGLVDFILHLPNGQEVLGKFLLGN